MRNFRVTVFLDPDEHQSLTDLASKVERTSPDTVRLLIRSAHKHMAQRESREQSSKSQDQPATCQVL